MSALHLSSHPTLGGVVGKGRLAEIPMRMPVFAYMSFCTVYYMFLLVMLQK